MVEESGDGGQNVNRDELVDHPVGQPGLQQFGGGRGAGGDQAGQGFILGNQPPQDFEQSQGFADADRMKPDQPTIGTRDRGSPQPFGQARFVGILARKPGADQPMRQRHAAFGRCEVKRQGEGIAAQCWPAVGPVLVLVMQPVQMRDVIAHMGIVDRALRLGLPHLMRLGVARIHADKVNLGQIPKLGRLRIDQFAAVDEVEELGHGLGSGVGVAARMAWRVASALAR